MDAVKLSYLVERYPLLITKLYIPRLDTELLARPHLMERLNRAVDRPLVVISAPAGWGKTTLVASWAQQVGRPVGWISLDEGDNDLARFWSHLIAALQQIRQGVGEAALLWFHTQEAPPVEARLTLLVNDLALAGEPFVLTMDDVHCIRSPVVHDSLAFFVEHLPPNVHLIMTSRSDLPLPLSRWRASRRLVEIDSQDLRFATAESAEFLEKVMGLDLTLEQVTALVDHTEGWVAGLQLAALALQRMPSQQGSENFDQFIGSLGGGSSYIFEYLCEEVLARQEPEIQEFLLKTSVLERLSGELCEAVTEVGDSQRILELLEHNKLFIVSLDLERHWYRYHHLFRDFLYSQLTRTWPDVVIDLHRRAAQWYSASRLPHEAVPHALVAKDYELAGRIIMEYANDLWRREEMGTLRTWLEALPGELRERYPDLCLFHAWSLFFTLGLDEMGSLVTRAKELLDNGEPALGDFSTGELRGILAVIQASIRAFQKNYDATFEFSQVALAQLPPEQEDWRYAALVPAGLAYHFRNDTASAVRAFEEAVTLKRGTGNRFGGAFAMSWLARLYMIQGRLHRAKEVYEEAIVLATGKVGKPLPIGAWAMAGLGEISYQWDDLELAEKYFNDSLELSTQITPATAPPYIPLARLAHARGDLHSAEAFFSQAVRLAESAGPPFYKEQVGLCRAWVALQQGDLATLEQWIPERGLELAQPSPQREAEHVMAVRILIALQDYPGAIELSERLLGIAGAAGRDEVVIELLILQSLALQGQNRLDTALAALERSITLASQEGHVRLFVDEGEAVLRLLRLIVARFGATDYSARLLGAFTRKSETLNALNEREMEILRLLATGMSNKEIGETLFITVGTVKWHTNHIYRKLEVKNRGQAVAKAREILSRVN
jgi:LuxR family maltose regulon positive regulatory protein